MDFEPACPPSIILCDHVITEIGSQKPTLIGCFQAFTAPSFPFTVPRFFVSVSIGNLRGMPNEADITLRLEQIPSAHPIGAATAHIKGDFKLVGNYPESVIQIPIPLGPIIFPTEGLYRIVLLLNGEEVAQRSIRVGSITTFRPQ